MSMKLTQRVVVSYYKNAADDFRRAIEALRSEFGRTSPGWAITTENYQKGVLEKHKKLLKPFLDVSSSKLENPVVHYIRDHFKLRRVQEIKDIWDERDIIEVGGRINLEALSGWHGSMGDPIYAVSSSGRASIETLEGAMSNLERSQSSYDTYRDNQLELRGLHSRLQVIPDGEDGDIEREELQEDIDTLEGRMAEDSLILTEVADLIYEFEEVLRDPYSIYS